MLNSMGANIKGLGSNKLIINGNCDKSIDPTLYNDNINLIINHILISFI